MSEIVVHATLAGITHAVEAKGSDSAAQARECLVNRGDAIAAVQPIRDSRERQG